IAEQQAAKGGDRGGQREAHGITPPIFKRPPVLFSILPRFVERRQGGRRRRQISLPSPRSIRRARGSPSRRTQPSFRRKPGESRDLFRRISLADGWMPAFAGVTMGNEA